MYIKLISFIMMLGLFSDTSFSFVKKNAALVYVENIPRAVNNEEFDVDIIINLFDAPDQVIFTSKNIDENLNVEEYVFGLAHERLVDKIEYDLKTFSITADYPVIEMKFEVPSYKYIDEFTVNKKVYTPGKLSEDLEYIFVRRENGKIIGVDFNSTILPDVGKLAVGFQHWKKKEFRIALDYFDQVRGPYRKEALYYIGMMYLNQQVPTKMRKKESVLKGLDFLTRAKRLGSKEATNMLDRFGRY